MSLREAAQQALEFVTSKQWGTTPYMDVRVYEDAARLRDALRAALAQQAEPVTFNEVDEQSRKVHAHLAKALRIPEMPWPDPHAHGHEAAARAIHTSYCAIRFELMDALARLTTLRATVAKAFAALAQQEQEPVAWRVGDSYWTHYDEIPARLLPPMSNPQPLFTHPPRREWVGLTEEEISGIFEAEPRYHYPPICATDREFARAIEAALKERNT